MPYRILAISLGGTIAMTSGARGGLTPSLAADSLFGQLSLPGDLASVETWTALTVASPSLTIPQIVSVAFEIRKRLASGFDGVVLVQGTDTLEETAFILDCLLDDQAPVIVTGAMRGARSSSADGPANIEAAIRVACDPQSRGRGTLVVFDDEIHAARYVRKVHTISVSPFRSWGRGPMGRIVDGKVRYCWRNERLPSIAVASAEAGRPVALLKFALGQDDRILRALPDLGYRGAVIEGAGGGHLAEAMMPAVRELAGAMPVVFASRCPLGPVLRSTYAYAGSEIDLLDSGALHAGDFCGIKARLLLTLLLMAFDDAAAVRAAFRHRADLSLAN